VKNNEFLSGLLEVIKELEEETTEKRMKVPVGCISDQLKREFKVWKNDTMNFEDEMALRKELLIRRVTRELKEYGQEMSEGLEKRRDELWEKVRVELQIEKGTDLNIDMKSGIISKLVGVDGQESKFKN
jgi:hypothetical protein